MDTLMNLEMLHLLIFTIPGFFAVWSYHRAKNKKIESDFEYLILSFFWGLVIMAVLGWIMPGYKFELFFKNIYSSALVLSLISISLGSIIGGKLDKYIDKLFLFRKKK
jgi:hypothetical protein